MDRPDLKQHHEDYGAGHYGRGNVTRSVIGGLMTRCIQYDIAGAAVKTWGVGPTTNIVPTANNRAPGEVTTGSLTTSFEWSDFLGLEKETGPNQEQLLIDYDAYGRPLAGTSPHGAQTSYTYSVSPAWTKAVTNGHWTKTSYDGLGRTKKVEAGDGGATRSVVDTEYVSCACAAAGKVKKVSEPYAPGGTIYWTEYEYDAMGRTTRVKHPANSGETTYVYLGNTVKVIDPAGKWKKYEADVFGNLVKVTEPRPGGGESVSNYFYTVLDQLSWVDLIRDGVTQSRDFDYDNAGRLTYERNPESGETWYAWNSDGTLYKKTAGGQILEERYSYDSYKRLKEIRYFSTASGSEAVDEAKIFTYDQGTYGLGRLTSVKYGAPTGGAGAGEFTESFTYTVGGLPAAKTIQVKRGSGSSTKTGSLTASYGYDSGGEGRLVSVTYPNGTGAYSYTLDAMKRPVTLKNPAQAEIASNALYDAAGRMTELKYGGYTGAWQFNGRGQLRRLKALRNSYPYGAEVDLEYNYSATANNGRVASMHDHVAGEGVSYAYDALNRLIRAEAPSWGQIYTYDGFGNLTDKEPPPGKIGPTWHVVVDKSTNRISGSNYAYDGVGNVTHLMGAAGDLWLTYTPDNRARHVTIDSDGAADYVYAPAGERVWAKTAVGTTVERVFFHGPGGRRLGQYKLVVGASAITFTTEFTNVYFGGKLIYRNQHTGGSVYPSAIVTDRVGSVVSAGPYQNRSYYPYGEEKGTPTANGADKFATYYRDEHTEFDYAMQRYYHSGSGRFLTPDPYRASGGPADSGSWNRYAYVQGDPVNFVDPEGLLVESVEEFMFCVNAPWTGPWGWKCGKRIFDEKYWILQADGSTTARGGGGPSGAQPPTDRELVHESRLRIRGLLDDDCVEALGAGTIQAARKKIGRISITYKDLGPIVLHESENGLGVHGSSGPIARYNPVLGFRGIHLNTNVNWGLPNATEAVHYPSGTAIAYPLLSAQAAALGTSTITSAQFMDLTILHELAHSFGNDHVRDEVGFERKLWKDCLQ